MEDRADRGPGFSRFHASRGTHIRSEENGLKTIVYINGANVGSTGRIVYGISALAQSRGDRVLRAYPKSRNLLPPREDDYIISSVPVKFLSTRSAWLTGLNGCFAWGSTQRLLKKLEQLKPDILHLHNLHDSYINLPMLFAFIKKHRVKVVWTLHRMALEEEEGMVYRSGGPHACDSVPLAGRPGEGILLRRVPGGGNP